MDQLMVPLVFLPGVSLFLGGLLYGLVFYFRYRRPSLRALQLQVVGIAVILALPAVLLIYLIAMGRAHPAAVVGVLLLLGFAALHVYVARGIHVPPGSR